MVCTWCFSKVLGLNNFYLRCKIIIILYVKNTNRRMGIKLVAVRSLTEFRVLSQNLIYSKIIF